MKAKKYKTDVCLTLNPPNVFKDIGKYRIELIRTISLDFVPYPGLCLRFEGKYPEQEVQHWSPLMEAACGPRGAIGLGFNHEIWPIDHVVYNVAEKRFAVVSYPEILTIEQLNALQE